MKLKKGDYKKALKSELVLTIDILFAAFAILIVIWLSLQ